MALGLRVVMVRPQTWQAAHNLYQWQAKLKITDPDGPTPLIVARRTWPDAPLEFKADDGGDGPLARSPGLLRRFQGHRSGCNPTEGSPEEADQTQGGQGGR